MGLLDEQNDIMKRQAGDRECQMVRAFVVLKGVKDWMNIYIMIYFYGSKNAGAHRYYIIKS